MSPPVTAPRCRAEPMMPSSHRWSASSLGRNVASNWALALCTLAYAFFITPIVVRALGQEGYGVWSFLNGLATYADLFYLGLGAAFVKYVAEYRAKGDRAALRRVISVVFTIYCATGVLILGVVIVASPLVPSLLGGNLAPAMSADAITACLLLGTRLTALFVASVFAGIIVAHDRYDLRNAVVIAFIASRFILVPLVVGGPHALVDLAAVMTITAWVEVFALAWLARAVTHGMAFGFCLPTAADLGPLYAFGLPSFFIIVSIKVISYTDTTVIGLKLGAEAVATYALPLQLAEYARYIITAMVSVLLPRLVALTATGHSDQLGPAFVRIARFSCFAAAVASVHFVLLGPAFLARWVGPAMVTEQTAPVLFWLGLTSFCQVLSWQVPLPFLQTLDLLRIPVAILAVEAAANLAGSLLLAVPFGTPGVAFATFLPCFAISFLLVPRHACRGLGLPLGRTFRQALTPAAIVSVIVVAALTATQYAISSGTYGALIVQGATGAAVALAVFVATFPVEDVALLLRAVHLDRVFGRALLSAGAPARGRSAQIDVRLIARLGLQDSSNAPLLAVFPINGHSAAYRLCSLLRALMLGWLAEVSLAGRGAGTTRRLGAYPSIEDPTMLFDLRGAAGVYARRFLVAEPATGLTARLRRLLAEALGCPTSVGAIVVVGARR